ncbi:MAG: hypothetical protein ACLFUM_04265 [Spirochaetaceae bacterium]
MPVFDLETMQAEDYENRDKNVFFEHERFKTRIIDLDAGGEMPDCQMESFVIFVVVSGSVTVYRNNEPITLRRNQVFITEPALLSMRSEGGAKLMGIRIGRGLT